MTFSTTFEISDIEELNFTLKVDNSIATKTELFLDSNECLFHKREHSSKFIQFDIYQMSDKLIHYHASRFGLTLACDLPVKEEPFIYDENEDSRIIHCSYSFHGSHRVNAKTWEIQVWGEYSPSEIAAITSEYGVSGIISTSQYKDAQRTFGFDDAGAK